VALEKGGGAVKEEQNEGEQYCNIWSSSTSCVARSENQFCVQKGQSAYRLFRKAAFQTLISDINTCKLKIKFVLIQIVY
jgi:hypothetical protein